MHDSLDVDCLHHVYFVAAADGHLSQLFGMQRFAASSGVYRPKQEHIRRERAKFVDPTGLRRLTLPYISCLHSYGQVEEQQQDGMSEPASLGGKGEVPEGTGGTSITIV